MENRTATGRHWMASLCFCWFSNKWILMPLRHIEKRLEGNNTKTLSRDGEIATNLNFSSYFFSIFYTVYNDHILLL